MPAEATRCEHDERRHVLHRCFALLNVPPSALPHTNKSPPSVSAVQCVRDALTLMMPSPRSLGMITGEMKYGSCISARTSSNISLRFLSSASLSSLSPSTPSLNLASPITGLGGLRALLWCLWRHVMSFQKQLVAVGRCSSGKHVRFLSLGRRPNQVIASKPRALESVVRPEQSRPLLDVCVVDQGPPEAHWRCFVGPHFPPHPHIAIFAHSVC